MRFSDGIYQPCVERRKNRPNILNDLDRGTAVLDSEVQCDQYIAFYGGLHFHKLYAAFESTNFEYTNGKKIEVIDWGCGQALATCVLIDYFVENRIRPDVVSITLVEPSLIALERGYNFTLQMLQSNGFYDTSVSKVHSHIDDLQPSDLTSDENTIKIHLFSNIIDVEAFDLEQLYQLMIRSFRGLNRCICISPDNGRGYRLDEFRDLFLQSHQIYKLVEFEDPILREVYYLNSGSYKETTISRYERQFTVRLI